MRYIVNFLLDLLNKSLSAQQVLWISLFASELKIQIMRFACAALLQQMTPACRSGGVEQIACFLERSKRISIQYG